jgi:hypothetical protein
MPSLILRRAGVSRPSGCWHHDDYDVFNGDRCVGRIFRQVSGSWFCCQLPAHRLQELRHEQGRHDRSAPVKAAKEQPVR